MLSCPQLEISIKTKKISSKEMKRSLVANAMTKF